jgi:hypothetical protein
MPALDLTTINVGGPCKIVDVAQVIYTEGDVKLEPKPVYREIPSSLGGALDSVLVDLVWTISGVPKSVWDSGTRASLLPAALTNFVTAGGRVCGSANRAVTVQGSDGEQFAFTRSALSKMPDVFMGLGKSLYTGFEYTGWIGTGKSPTDPDAFYTQSTGVAWTQADYPVTHQEALCTAAWGAVAGWGTVFAEEGFTLTHELKLNPVKMGNITVDQRVESYRAMVGFKPQGPTTAQLLAAIGLQGTAMGIGTRLSALAHSFVVTGTGLSVTVPGAALNKGAFEFDSKLNRHGDFGMITALSAPGARLTLA